jgi:hypothetical protein
MKGGARTGAGRKAGVPLQKTREIREAVHLSGITPLEHMINVVRAAPPTKMEEESEESFLSRCRYHFKRQDDMASAAAPYLHPRLATIETRQDPQQFATEQKAKIAAMDVTEIARRVAFVILEAQRLKKQNPIPPKPETETRVH